MLIKIYIGHSKDINYMEELYKPIREFNNTLDIFIVEVSLPTTSLGI